MGIGEQTHVTQFIGDIFAVTPHSPDHKILSGGITGIYFRGPLVIYPQNLVKFEPKTIEKLLGIFLG